MPQGAVDPLTRLVLVNELPYDGGDTSMLVIAPNRGTFDQFETVLTGAGILQVLAGLGLEQKPVQLSFPKTKLTSAVELRKSLESLGMRAAFDNADFSGISTVAPMVISAVYHQTFLDIDEGGTEAAAATGVVSVTTSEGPPLDYVTMNVNRPYVIAIVDRQTKTLLFLGRIVDPG